MGIRFLSLVPHVKQILKMQSGFTKNQLGVKRPCCRLCGRDSNEAVRGSNILPKPSVVPATAQPRRGRVWLPSSSRGPNNPFQRRCLG